MGTGKPTGRPQIDLTGRVRGAITVVGEAERDEQGKRRWIVRCLCGNEIVVAHRAIIVNHIKSCGCRRHVSQWRAAAEALETGEKPCAKCKQTKPLCAFPASKVTLSKFNSNCRECIADTHLRRTFGISAQEKQAIIERQGGKCAIRGCSRSVTMRSHLDHCHESGQVRSVLCLKCNAALGYLNEDPRHIRGLAEYAEQWKQLRLVPTRRTA